MLVRGAFFLMASLLLTHCAGSRPTPVVAPQPVFPPGVDSTVALNADSISRELFVEWRRQHLAEQAAERGETQFQIGDELL
ncbi:MAG: hypothetical protein D6681_13050, partial [Calditrichaeota bacterium]